MRSRFHVGTEFRRSRANAEEAARAGQSGPPIRGGWPLLACDNAQIKPRRMNTLGCHRIRPRWCNTDSAPGQALVRFRRFPMRRMNRWTAWIQGSSHLSHPSQACQKPLRWLTPAVCLAIAACGGGGGGNESRPEPFGLVKVTAVDSFGGAVAGATVTGPQGSSKTDAMGGALVVTGASGSSANVTLSLATFVDQSITISSVSGKINEVAVTLKRATSAAGGSLSSRSGIVPTISSNGQQMSFEIELVVVDGNSQALENLTPANFVLRSCTPDPVDSRVDCVRGSGPNADKAYAPMQTSPEALALIAGRPAQPYASGLLLDQSGSISQSDPTGARLFATKAFLNGLGAGDQVLIAAFAGGSGALIPTAPLTQYTPFRDRASAASYYPTLDSLAPLLGGDTPLYQSLDTFRQQVVGATSLPAGLAKAVVIFTDGADTRCGSPETCQGRRAQSIMAANQDQLRVFTIGLSKGVDVAALGELANQTGGAFLYADSAEQLIPLYGSVGRLLSLSLSTYRLRWTVQASAAGAFQPGYALVGHVQVNAGSSSFDVPFIVGIP